MFIVLPLIVSDTLLNNLIIDNTKIAISIPMIILPFGIKYIKAITVLSVIISLFIMINSGSKPLLYALKNMGDFSGLVLSREDARGSVIKIPYIEFWLRQIIFPIIIVYYFAIFDRKMNFKNFAMFFLFLFYGSIYGFFNLVKSPFVVIMLSIIIYKHLTIKKIKTMIKPIISFVLVILSVMIMFLRLFSPGRSISNIIGALWNRVFYEPAFLTNNYIEIFSNNKLNGQSMPLLYLFSGENRFNLANYVFNVNYPNALFNTGTAPASFVGEGFANFGFGIIVFYSIVLSFLLSITFKVFSERNKTPLMVSLYAVIHYSFYELIRTSFFTVLTSYGVLLILLIACIVEKPSTHYDKGAVVPFKN